MIQESRVKDQPRTTEVRRPVTEWERERVQPDYRTAGLPRVTWSAVIAGAVAAMAAQVLFAALGLAIGLSLPGAAGAEGIGIFAGIWWLVTGLIALFIGGWVAGRFTASRNETDAGLHGVMTWALATALSVLFVTTLGGLAAGGAVGAIANDISPRQGQAATSPDMQQSPRSETPMPGAEQVTESAAGAAWWTFFALLLGLVAAGAGGYVAAPRDNVDYGNIRDSSTSSGTTTTGTT